MTPKEVIELAKANDVKIIDIKFCDLFGTWQHFSVAAKILDEDLFNEGIGFDGSSIRGFQKINESDMLLFPDPNFAFIDPFTDVPTLSLVCDIKDPMTGAPYSRDPRYTAKKAEQYLKDSGIADVAYFGAESEFFIFDEVRFDYKPNSSMHFVDSSEAAWNTGRAEEGGNLGYKIPYKGGYFPVAPFDKFQDLRTEMMLTMIEAGIDVEVQHHEVATAGQAEIDLKFGPLLKHADDMILYKYIVKNVAAQNGYTATFMPKPLFQDNGSGMHTHVSFWKDGETLMFQEGTYANLSDLARWYIGGVLLHAPAVLAFAAPTTNSYRRLVPGYEAPIYLAYSNRNRSAACRIPAYSNSPKAKRVEFRAPDPSSNPYLCFSALLMAGLDGIKNKIEPPAPVDHDIYEMTPAELEERGIKQAPGSLDEALSALETDHDFLLEGGVFTKDLIENYIEYKRINEVDAIRLRPHPYEFALYFNV
ncbi:MAG: type I glutamate--ammonia ligase [Capsulimonadales bacterium]|nr:type I glutamate--ammonia ligase [Capsulimonadales bacterium]